MYIYILRLTLIFTLVFLLCLNKNVKKCNDKIYFYTPVQLKYPFLNSPDLTGKYIEIGHISIETILRHLPDFANYLGLFHAGLECCNFIFMINKISDPYIVSISQFSGSGAWAAFLKQKKPQKPNKIFLIEKRVTLYNSDRG